MVNFPASELTNYKTTLLNKSGVYAIYNPVNGKYYIGSSVNLWYRIRKYGQISNITRSPHRPINKAIVKYGFNNLIIIILEFTTRKDAIVAEQKYFDIYSPQYNVLKFAGSTRGRRHTEATKEKMRLVKLGKKMSPEAASGFIYFFFFY